MNFIIKLLKSKEPGTEIEYNSIYIMVDWLTKHIYFIPFNKDMRVADIAYLFHQNITTNHEPSAEIISNRDMRFRLTFWKELMAHIRIKVKISILKHA